MKISVNNAQTQNKEFVYEENTWTGKKKITYNGQILNKISRGKYEYKDGESAEIFEIKGNQFLGMKVVMFGQEVELIRQLVWYEIFLSLLVIVPGLMCGAIGGLIAGILGFTTFTLMRKLEKWPAKVGVALAILVAEVVLLFVLGWLVLKIFKPIF
ncbi:MAG: hypothetical protein IKY15_00205 [Clostridia bacterium]|nr:hypothetical protein [Clostridia bacterium]